MTAKEKAQDLVKKFRMYDIMICDPMGYELEGYEERHYKRCALIVIEEILLHVDKSYQNESVTEGAKSYWNQVKQEIENL